MAVFATSYKLQETTLESDISDSIVKKVKSRCVSDAIDASREAHQQLIDNDSNTKTTQMSMQETRKHTLTNLKY